MNDEIKEIYLSNLEWTKTHDNMGGVIGNLIFKDNMPYEEYEKLLKSGYFVLCNKDYITNLQQENERLKDSRDWWQDRFFGQQEYDDSHRITAIEYKKRIDRAIEYIDNSDILDIHHKNRHDLLNILQNGSEEK